MNTAPEITEVPAADFFDTRRAVPPADDEIEVSLFGPGFGECIAIHIGAGEWVIVDSCYFEDGVTPAAIEYLRAIKVDPAKAVTHIIISHTDNDHIGGAAKMFATCEAAELVISSAFANRDVAAWIAANSDVDPSELARASTEMATILENVSNRKKSPIHAIIDRPIIDRAGCRITALSPNDQRISAFVKSVVSQLPQAGKPRRRVAELTPNQACVALLIETPMLVGILGADLEEKPGFGWTYVIKNSIAYGKADPALLLKVPHHGSSNADCNELWERLEQSPIAILATYNKGSKLPTTQDVERISGRTQNAYSCSTFTKMAAAKDSNIDKFLRMMEVKRTRRFPSSGQIRTRFSNRKSTTIELFGAATHVSKVY